MLIFYMIIPKGKKSLLWFTYYNDQNVCFLLELNKKNIKKITLYPLCFDSKLSYGTILFGTHFTHKNTNFFSCENIHFYKGKKVEYFNFTKKIDLFHNIFSNEISQKIYAKSMLFVGLPIIHTNYNKLMQNIQDIDYPVHSIQIQKRFKSHPSGYYSGFQRNKQLCFLVKATIYDDIYHLYYNNNGMPEYYDIALINDYKTSVFMNNLFRTIKENNNLDLLEESDDEEEFQNVNEAKFVNLEKKNNNEI